MKHNKENLNKILFTLEAIAEDNEATMEWLNNNHGTAEHKELHTRNIACIRACMEFMNCLESTMRGLWNHGWATGQADRVAGIHNRDYSETFRETEIEKLLEIKLP